MLSDWLDRENLHECPRCGKRSLARISEHRYQCLWCRFYRDCSRGAWGSGRGDQLDPGLVVVTLIAIIVVLMFLS